MKEKELNLCKNIRIFGLPYKKRYIIRNLIYIKRGIISIYQRIKYGISRQDAWDFDSYLLMVIENGLKYLKDSGNSHPTWCTYEEWQNKLLYMIKLSELSNLCEDEVSDSSFDRSLNAEKEYGKDSEEHKKALKIWLEDIESFENTKRDSTDKLLKELRKYIHDLWD